LNIGMVGNSDVGKTSLIKRFVYGDKFDSKSRHTTIGVDQF
jgi:GTPase SAR1 family protein